MSDKAKPRMKVYAVTMKTERWVKYLIEARDLTVGNPYDIRQEGYPLVDDTQDTEWYVENIERLEVGSIDEALEKAEELDLYSFN